MTKLTGAAHPQYKHGLWNSLTYQRWTGMKARVRRDPRYVHRTIDPRWESFENFYADMGECPPGYSLERVDNDGNYEPGNCKWIPWGDQAKNSSQCVRLTYKGRTQILADWARETGLNPRCLGKRINSGWSVERALEEPTRRRKHD